MSAVSPPTRRRSHLELYAVAKRRPLLLSSSSSSNANRPYSSTFPTTQKKHDLFKPWGVKCVEATGDFRQDTWLEKHIGGPLYEKQADLPRLPVPTIQDTLERFLPTAIPLAETDEERETLLQAVQKFPSQAQTLQQRLEQRAVDYKDSSWLQHWWNTAGYLQVRDSVVINVSYYFDFCDDPSANNNIQRGAAMLTAAAEFRQQICSGSYQADHVGRGDRKKPLCSTMYKYMFHACRVPLDKEDTYRIYDPALHHHAIVARKGHFFKVDFCDPVSGEPLPLSLLQRTLERCIEKADQLEAGTSPNLPKLGWLTGQHRDDCAKGRAALLEYGGEPMKQALEVLESGALLLCLDDEDVVSRKESALLYLHGGMTSGQNRWFDKSIQICVGNNGKAGYNGEHSMMDGMPVISLADHLTKQTYAKCLENSTSDELPMGEPTVEPIFTPDLYPAMEQAAHLVQDAKTAHAEWTGKHSLNVQTFQGYGSTFMKQSGFSPDAFVQMAMQLATYRLWGKQAGTYEATQVRPFLHGRTETTRAVTEQSAAFVKAFGLRPEWDEDKNSDACAKKLDLLHQAVSAHVKYIGAAAQAQGVDRHFFGLSMIADGSTPMPDLYSHPVFARSKRWRVSTSNLSHPRFENWGYGEVVPDGVGLSYSIHPRHCQFSVTALKEHGWTDKLAHLLEESLLELRRLIEASAKDNDKPNSRL